MERVVSPNSRPIFPCCESTLANSSSSSSLSWSTPTTSTSITETVNGCHRFNISGYSLLKGMGIGKHVASDTFTVGGHSWAIYFYPDGESVEEEDNPTYVSLYVVLASKGTDVRALFALTLSDGKGRRRVYQSSGPCSLNNRGCMWGYPRLIKRIALETSDYIKDDCLSVHCSVGVVRSYTIKGPQIDPIAVPPSNIGQNLGQPLETGKGKDVNFKVGEPGFLDQLLLQRVQLAISTSPVQILKKCFGMLRVGAGPSRSQQDEDDEGGSRDNEGSSGSRGTRRSSHRRTQGPSNEDENNQPRQFLAKHGNLLCVVFLFYCLFIFLFTCLFYFWVRDLGVFKKLL